MTLEDYMRVFRRYWIGIAASTLAGILIAAAVSLLMPRVYEADASGFVTMQNDGNAGMASVVDSYSKSRAKSYLVLAKNRNVADRVIETLNLDTTSEKLVTRITASVPTDTVNMQVTATASTPQEAQDLANAWIVALSQEIAVVEGKSQEPSDPDTGQSAREMVQLVPQTTALFPAAPVSPNTRLNLLLGLLIGLAVGVGYALVRNSADKRVRSAEVVERTFNIPVVGTLPIDALLDKADTRLIGTTATSAKNPNLRLAEALRELRTNIQFINIDNPPKIMVMTSPVPQDGKSTVAANLALTIAETGQRVVLVDADLRRPTVAKTFGITEKVGLTDVIVGKVPIAQVLQRSALNKQLYILPAGTIPPNPSELVGSQALYDLLHQLAEHAIVLVDAPPLLPVADSAILAARNDGAFIVINAGKTHIDALAKALSNIEKVNGKTLGVIINRVPVHGSEKAEYGYYAGYYNTYVSEVAHQPESVDDDLVEGLSQNKA